MSNATLLYGKSGLRDEKGEADASGDLIDGGERFIVYTNSVCNMKLSSQQDEIQRWREGLKHKGVIAQTENDEIVFLQDHTFNFPSTAACVIRGGSSYGWTYWKHREGKTLDERFRKYK